MDWFSSLSTQTGLLDRFQIPKDADSNAHMTLDPSKCHVTASHSSLADFSHHGPTRLQLCALRDTDILVCLHAEAEPGSGDPKSGEIAGKFSLIKMMSLASWKRTCIKQAEGHGGASVEAAMRRASQDVKWKELRPHFNFHASQIELNGNGKLLAIAGLHEVYVQVVPPSVKTAAHRIETRVYKIGAKHHAPNLSTIVQVRWHPLSSSQSHLVILTADGLLRMYDTGQNPDYPEQTISFVEALGSTGGSASSSPGKIVRKNRSGMFGLDLDEFDPVGFDFGKGTGWRSFTVNVIMKNGDMYFACPFLPSKSTCNISLLREIKSQNDAKSKTADSSEYTQRQCYWRNRWIEETLSSVATDNPGYSVSMKVPRGLSKLLPHRQGPIATLQSSSHVCDMAILGSEPFNTLFVATDQGEVNVLVELDSPEPMWIFPGILDEAEVLGTSNFMLIEQFDFGRTLETDSSDLDSYSLKIRADRKSQDLLYIAHSQGLHSISMRAWMEPLSNILANDIGGDAIKTKLAKFLGERESSEVRQLVHAGSLTDRNFNPTGLVFSRDLYLGYNAFIMTCDQNLFGKPLSVHQSAQAKPTTSIRKVNTNFKTVLQESFQIPTDIDDSGNPRTFSFKTLAGKSTEVTKDNLQQLVDFGKDFNQKIAIVKGAGIEISDRFEDLQLEVKSQAKHLTTINQQISKLRPRTERMAARATELMGTQDKIKLRADALHQRLVDSLQKELSEEEKAWFEELKKLSLRINNDMSKRIHHLRTEMQSLAELVQKGDLDTSSPQKAGALGSAQMRKINDALLEEYKIISSAWKRFQELKVALDSAM
ncbi:hypothetical protein HDU76_004958 [Blyttiomyces sp. JEL0837]|nr:hypothetical protein HDU76_004958 [Blyttiomyces sp. JEL0837]